MSNWRQIFSVRKHEDKYPGGSGWIDPNGEWYFVPFASHASFAARELGWKDEVSTLAIDQLLKRGWIRVSLRSLQVWDPWEARDSLLEYLTLLDPNSWIDVDIDSNDDHYQGPVEQFRRLFLGA